MSDIPTTAGVYCILNGVNGKIYVGSAVNLRQRQREHFRYLARGYHHNRYLQNSFNKYGLSAFSFHVIEIVNDKEALIQREQHYIDETECCDSDKGYNLSPTAGSQLGFKHSGEARVKMSAATRGERNPMWGKCGEKHHNWGKQFSDEARAKRSDALHGRTLSVEHRRNITAGSLRRWKRYYAERDELQLLLF